MTVEAGREISIGCDPKERYWHRTWADEVSDVFYERKIQLKSDEEEKHNVSKNKVVMYSSIEHVRITG